MDTIQLLSEALAPVAGKRILDIGCGHGHLARALDARGAKVTGIDPDAAAVEAACRTAPECAFSLASAEALPFPDEHFEASVFLNSLHHVPPEVMAAALDEAARVTACGGSVIVIEPLAEGSFFSAFRRIEDETAVRRQAQDAIAAALARGALERLDAVTFTRVESFRGFDAFVERATAANPARLEAIERDRGAIEAEFTRRALQDGNGTYRLEQPLKADILVRPAGQR